MICISHQDYSGEKNVLKTWEVKSFANPIWALPMKSEWYTDWLIQQLLHPNTLQRETNTSVSTTGKF